MSWALTAENDAAQRALQRAARKRPLIMSTAPVGGRPIEAFVDAIRPRADRLLERFTPPQNPGTSGPTRGPASRKIKCRRPHRFRHLSVPCAALRGEEPTTPILPLSRQTLSAARSITD